METSDAPLTYKVYRRRWFMMTLYCLASASNALLWITFSPINTLVQSYFGISAAAVNALSIVFLAAYIPFSFASNWVFSKYGTYVGIVLASVLDCFCGLLRFLSTESNSNARGNHPYAVLMAGQALGAIAQPFFTNAPALLASRWFPTSERDVATVIMSLANPIGIAIGSVLPTAYVVGDDVGVDMFDLLLVEFIITAVILIIIGLLFRDKPPTPPSNSECLKAEQKMPLKDELKMLFTNRQYLILFVSFGTGLGFFNALTTLVEQLTDKSGYSTDDASLFSGLLIGCGLIASIIVGLVLDRTHFYNSFLKGLFVLGGIFILVFVLLIRPNYSGPLAFIFAAMGATMLPLLPVSFECAAECTFPVREDMSTGGLMSAGQLTGIVFIVVLGKLLDRQPQYESYVFEPAYILIVVCIGLCVLGILFFKGKYLRLAADQERKASQQVSSSTDLL